MRIVIARCTVNYVGRLTAYLPEAVRVIMVKGDGSVLIHSDGGSYKPLNWMSPPCTIRIQPGAGEVNTDIVWVVENKAGEQRIRAECATRGREKRGLEGSRNAKRKREFRLPARAWCANGVDAPTASRSCRRASSLSARPTAPCQKLPGALQARTGPAPASSGWSRKGSEGRHVWL